VRYDPDALGVQAKQLHDLVTHKSGGYVHESAAAGGARHEARVGQRSRQAHLRVAQRRQVVHRYYPARVSSRGHDVIRAVHDIDATHKPFDRRQ
jgi:hypothetical protein